MSRFHLAILLPYDVLYPKYRTEMLARRMVGLPELTMVDWCEWKDRIADNVQKQRRIAQDKLYGGNQ